MAFHRKFIYKMASLKSLDNPSPIQFPLAIVPISSTLYAFLSGQSDVPIPRDSNNNILTDIPSKSLLILRQYLLTGRVTEEDLTTLVQQLDYWNIYHLK